MRINTDSKLHFKEHPDDIIPITPVRPVKKQILYPVLHLALTLLREGY